MKTSFNHSILTSFLALLGVTLFGLWPDSAQAGIAYLEPAGGWQYVYTGDQASGAARRQNQPALDGTWRHENGSDEWNGDVRGAANSPPGGVEANSADGVNYLTIEDAVTSTSGSLNNRKVYFTHSLTQEGIADLNLLDAGVTLSFRARLTPSDGKEEIALPNGYGIFSGGKGQFGVRQSSPSSIVSFSLVRDTEDGDSSNTLLFPHAGLTMNGNVGDAPDSSGTINAGANSRTSAALNPNTLAVDPTGWHEFWITIQANDATAGNGTHTVNVYVDGSTTPQTFNVTAATGNDTDTTLTPNWTDYICLGSGNSPTVGAFDTDFFAYKAGVHVPTVQKVAIAWVSFHPADETPSANAAAAGFTEAPDAGYTRLLEQNGFEVTRILSSATPDAALLNTFDLVIIGRSVPSGNYQGAGATAWNSITAPMMVMGGYTMRNSRMGYTTGATIPDTATPISLTVNDPTHPIFAGIPLDAGNTMVNLYAGIATFLGTTERGISVNTDPVAGGGTVLATVATAGDPAFGGLVIGEWAAGAVMANTAADVLAGPRLAFLSGSREHSGLTSEGAGIYDLEPDGAQMFLRAVQYMTGTLPADVNNTLGDQPQNLTVTESEPATFSVTVTGGPVPYGFQWFFNGAEIPGANSDTYTIPHTTQADAGQYYVTVTNRAGGRVVSSVATLTVLEDLTAPTVVSATGDETLERVILVFSEAINPGAATDLFNYAIIGLTIDPAIEFDGDRTVVLKTSHQAYSTEYTVEIFNIPDLAGNTVADPTTITFTSTAATPPQVVGVASVGGDQVDVEFNEAVNPDNAGDPFNWSVSDVCGDKTIVAVTNYGPARASLILDPATPVTGTFTVTVRDVTDLAGTAMPETTVTGTRWASYAAAIGGASPTGARFAGQPGSIQVQADGADIWGTADQFNFVYDLETADFDKKMKVTRLDPTDQWSKAALMARLSLDAGSPNTAAIVTSPQGVNVFNVQWRLALAASSSSLDSAQRPPITALPVWARVKRTGTTYEFFYSRDGVTWQGIGNTPAYDRPELAGPVLVGPGTTSHSAGNLTTVDYEEYGDTVTYPDATLTCTGLSDLTVPENALRTLTVTTTLSGAPEGLLQYRWYTAPPGSDCFALLDNAYGPSLTLRPLTLADSGTRIKAVASVPGQSALCGPVTITVVDDQNPPLALGASATLGMDQVLVQFNELIDEGTANDFFNYDLPDNSVVNARLNPDGTSVTVDLQDALASGQSYCLLIQGIADLAGNVIETTNLCFQSLVVTCGGALMEVYLNVPNGDIPSLTTSPNFPNNPDVAEIAPSLELPRSFGDNYGVRFTGWLLPPVTGAYHFAISSDDNSEFWLSTDAQPLNKQLIASEPQWNNARDWTGTDRRTAGAPENQSATLFPDGIPLVAGNQYYFELIMNEGTGGDNVAVTWQIPGTPPIANGVSVPIGGGYLATAADPTGSAITITAQPQDTSVQAFTPAAFTVAATALNAGQDTPVFYQWQKDDGTGNFVNIPGADAATYQFLVDQCQGSAVYRARLCAAGSEPVFSQTATLTILPDVAPPVAVSAQRNSQDRSRILVVFDRIVDPNSATDPFHYLLNNGVTVTTASLGADGSRVTLTVDTELQDFPCNNYVLRVVGVNNACLAAASDSAVEIYLEAPLTLDSPAIVTVVETGGDNEATDTVTAKWTGVTFTSGVANEPINGTAATAPYTVGYFGDMAPAFVDRRHAFFAASATVPIPAYLINQEYIMCGNDNRDNASYLLDVTVSKPVTAYMLIDNRLADGNLDDPPTFDATHMQWMLDEGWAPVQTGNNRNANPNAPDEVGIDESADGDLEGWYSVYSKAFPAGTFQIKQADNAGRNMYGVVVGRQIGLRLIQNVVEIGGDNEATDTVKAQWTGRTFVNNVANEPIKNTPAGAPYTVGYFGYKAPAYVDRNHAYYAADGPLPIPGYLLNQEYIMAGNDNKDNTGYQLDITVSAPARVYFLYDQRNTLPAWISSEGFQPVQTGANRTADKNIPDEVGIDESADGSINQRFNIYSKVYPVGTFSIYAQAAGGNMYGVVIARGPTIGNIVESGGDNEATDTITAKWTGVTWNTTIANEPMLNTPAGTPYTVPVFDNLAPAFVDRAHRYYVNLPNVPIPPYLVGREYIMTGNDNRDNASYVLNVTLNSAATVYMLIDNRLSDGDNATPPTFDASHMQWIVDEGWEAVITGNNRNASMSVPDEVAFDESADNTIEQYYSVYAKTFPAGTCVLKQADNSGRNMYGVVVAGITLGNAVQNNPPTFDLAMTTVESLRNGGPQSLPIAVNISAGPPSESAQNITGFDIVANDNPDLFTSLAIAPDGTLTYEAVPDRCGLANLTIVAHDDGGAALDPQCPGDTSLPASFSIWIYDVNSCPVALDQQLALDEDTTLPVVLTADDPDLLSGCGPAVLTFEVVTPPAFGTLSGTPPELVYTPEPNFCGTDTFTFTVSDGECAAATPGVVTLEVAPAPDCPVPLDQHLTVPRGSATPITLQATDPDAICEPVALSFWVIPPSHGILRGTGADLTYTPAPDYCGADSFLFLVCDGVCFMRGVVTLEISGGNLCPVANPQTVTTPENTPVSILLTGTDPDEGGCGRPIEGYAVAQQPAHGTLSGTPPALTYTPAADFNGCDAFTFTATDGECVSEPATVRIEITADNDVPVCRIVVGPLLQLTPDAVGNLVLACDNLAAQVVLDATLSTDPENDALTYVWMVDGQPVGTDALQTATLEVGTHEITLVVNDNAAVGAGSSTCTLTVSVVDGCEAVEELMLLVEQSDIARKLKQTFHRELREACAQFAHGRCAEGLQHLMALQDKIRHYDEYYLGLGNKNPNAKKFIDHETALRLIDAIQALIDAYEACGCTDA
ncbi:MAG: tandem-95 repeat protein [Verrucomicrobia bacterium]|nr:tandem-95 repeat protein [Verrucomicrobiota bacterium]